MTAMAAVAMGVAFTSCSHNTDLYGGEEGGGKINGRTVQEQIELDKAVYKAAFEQSFGKVAPTVDWGFGSSTRALTRASDLLKEKFTLPEFRDKEDITEPTWPGLPTTLGGKSFYTTWAQVEAAKIPCANDVSNTNNEWTGVYTAYIDATHTNIRADRSKGRTYYVNGSVTYPNGLDNDGATFIVLEGCSLKLGATNYNLTVYLCKNAVLDITENLNWDGTPTIDWQGNKSTSFKIEKSGAAIYMSEGSKVKAGNLRVAEGATVINNGGTIEAATLDVVKANFYNKGGSVDVAGKFYAQGTSTQNVEFLLADGCSLKANEIEMDDYCTLWANGNVTADNTITAKNQLVKFYIAPGKKMTANNLNLTNNSDLLVNDGTVEVTNGGSITLQNSGAEIVNNANMSCASFSMAAGAMMFNVGNMTMTGKTFINNSNSGWQNEGEWECGSLEITGDDKTAGNVFNNCRLTVNGLFDLNRGSFILDSNAGVVCESFRIDDTSGFYFGNNSVLKIDGTLTTEIINPEYGFFAYGSEYAAVQANSIVSTTDDPESINYTGKLLVATSNHTSPYTTQDYPTTKASDVKFTKDGQNIAKIPATRCNPGYESDGGNTESYTYRVIAEDLTANQGSDFDFNDVVFDVDPDEGGTGATITILAAGGIWPLTINGVEVHEKLIENIQKTVKYTYEGVEYDCYPMINTHEDGDKWINTNNQPTIRVTTGAWDTDENIRNSIKTEIVLKVFKYGDTTGTELEANEGVPTCKILVDRSYSINSERNNISDGTKFKDYVQGKIGTRVWW